MSKNINVNPDVYKVGGRERAWAIEHARGRSKRK